MSGQGKPGFMSYFSVEPAVRRLSLEQIGRLYLAMHDFARDETRPDFADDPKLEMAFDFIAPALAADNERYIRTVQKKQYAAFCRTEKDADRTPPNFNGWLQMQSHDSACNHVQPNTNTNTNTNPNTNPNTKVATSPALSGKKWDLECLVL